ncbi:MAG: alpha/beta hydrolase, partial [Cyclobacteriaceae bacterium]|nr:alpha/beta hydrolase [Cyclobacteriaceae bacterium]
MKLKSYIHALILLLALSLAGCSKQQKNQEFVDHETIEKNAEFRSTIASGDFVKSSAGNTYYEIANKDADTVLVLVHGFSVPSYIWDSTYYAAQQRGYGVLRYDVYGRGYSDNPDVAYDGALYSEQLHELLDALKIT